MSVDENCKIIRGQRLFKIIYCLEVADREVFVETGGLHGYWPSPKKHNIFCVRNNCKKLIYNDSLQSWEFYDLQNYPLEKNNIFDPDSDEIKNFIEKSKQMISWQEDLFVYGTDLSEVKNACSSGSYFHVEVFQAIAGKHAELFKQREMENVFLKTLNRPQNLIFVRDQGAGWGLFTLGLYRDIKHFAESADIDSDKENDA